MEATVNQFTLIVMPVKDIRVTLWVLAKAKVFPMAPRDHRIASSVFVLIYFRGWNRGGTTNDDAKPPNSNFLNFFTICFEGFSVLKEKVWTTEVWRNHRR